MKKFVVYIILFLIVILSTSPTCFASKQIPNPFKGTTVELYQDIIVSLLEPKIQKQITEYYKKCYKFTPTVYPYQVQFLDVERLSGYRAFIFLLRIQTQAVIGPHIDVGLDHLVFQIDGSGNVQLKKFEHIITYELPPRYKEYQKCM